MRTYHRIIALFVLIFTLYLGVTGSLIQITDLYTLYANAPETDPNKKAIREGLDGTSDFQVINVPDYTAPVLPANFDYAGSLTRVLARSREALQDAPLQYIEFRMLDGQPVGQAKTEGRLLRFGANDGVLQGEGKPPRGAGGTFGRSLRNTFKGLHRLTSFGNWTLWINIFVGVSLCVMLVTGLVMYCRLLSARASIKKPGLFWSAGGNWRSLHRAISLVSAVFVIVIVLTGTWLAVESLGRSYLGARERALVASGVPIEDPGAPLTDQQLPGMMSATLAAYRGSYRDTPLRAIRLRVYGGMSQGVVISGGPEAQQLVFNTSNGRSASMTEPGYPPQHFPFGWQSHQIAKKVHRGDFIGLSGRWMDLFGALSLLYLTISGGVMYVELWRRRRKAGRAGVIWK